MNSYSLLWRKIYAIALRGRGFFIFIAIYFTSSLLSFLNFSRQLFVVSVSAFRRNQLRHGDYMN